MGDQYWEESDKAGDENFSNDEVGDDSGYVDDLSSPSFSSDRGPDFSMDPNDDAEAQLAGQDYRPND